MLKELNDAYINITEMMTVLYFEIMNYFAFVSLIIVGVFIFLGGTGSLLYIYSDKLFKDNNIFDEIAIAISILAVISIFVLWLYIIFNVFRKHIIKYVIPIYKFKKLHNSLSFDMYKIKAFLSLFNDNESKVKMALMNYDEIISKIRNKYLEQLFAIREVINSFIYDSKNRRFFYEYDNSKLNNLFVEYNNNVHLIENIISKS